MPAPSPQDPPRRPDQPYFSEADGPRAGLASQFLLAVSHQADPDGLDPSDLAYAAAHVLRVDAAGIALLFNELRIPLGASSDDARRAEQAQTTLGTGPCLDAAELRTQIVADRACLEEDYPLYAEVLSDQTSFRSVAAVPLRVPSGGVIAALDLFSTTPDVSRQLDPRAVDQLARLVGGLLAICLDEIIDIDLPEAGPDWYQQATKDRHDVWIAVGMVTAAHAIRTRDALDLLRAHAYSQNTTLDALSANLISGRISTDGLLAQ